MLIIYFKSDGEIYQVATGYSNLEDFFGKRASEFGMIFDAIYIEEENDYIFNRFMEFNVDLETKELRMMNNSLMRSMLKY